jgi:3-hydroxyacyl-CoA dehydrogenase
MEELGKAPVVVRVDVPGFVVNRLQYALLREAYALVDAASAASRTSIAPSPPASVRAGPAIGPFETMDLAGLDVHAAVAENLWPELATTTKPSRSIEAARERGSIRADFDAEELKARRDRVYACCARHRENSSDSSVHQPETRRPAAASSSSALARVNFVEISVRSLSPAANSTVRPRSRTCTV